MTEAGHRYRDSVHYQQHKASVAQALAGVERDLQGAGAAVAAGNPPIRLLEAMRAGVELALREARGMANMDDAAMTGGPAA